MAKITREQKRRIREIQKRRLERYEEATALSREAQEAKRSVRVRILHPKESYKLMEPIIDPLKNPGDYEILYGPRARYRHHG